MTTRALLLGTVLAFACAAAAPATELAKRQSGQIVYDNVPETPAALKTAIAPYYNARSAVFEDWMDDGSILIATRFGAPILGHQGGTAGIDAGVLRAAAGRHDHGERRDRRPDQPTHAKPVGGHSHPPFRRTKTVRLQRVSVAARHRPSSEDQYVIAAAADLTRPARGRLHSCGTAPESHRFR